MVSIKEIKDFEKVASDEPEFKLRPHSIAYILCKTAGFLEYHPQLHIYQTMGVPAESGSI